MVEKQRGSESFDDAIERSLDNGASFVASNRLRPVTNEPGKTFLEWPREFGIAPGGDPAVILPMMIKTTAGHVAALP